jgi:hypothetical protein
VGGQYGGGYEPSPLAGERGVGVAGVSGRGGGGWGEQYGGAVPATRTSPGSPEVAELARKNKELSNRLERLESGRLPEKPNDMGGGIGSVQLSEGVGTLLTFAAVSAPILTSLGSVCMQTNDDPHVQKWCSSGLGAPMLVLGSLETIVLSAGVLMSSVNQQYHSNGLLVFFLYAIGQILMGFGSVCVATNGQDLCGAAGLSGGDAMVVVGCFFVTLTIFCVWYAYIYGAEGEKQLEALSVPISRMLGVPIAAGFCYVPVVLMIAGSICVETGDMCGAGGHEGGVIMLVLSCLITVGVPSLILLDYWLDELMVTNSIAIAVAYLFAEVLSVIGALCVHSDRHAHKLQDGLHAHKWCGAGGYDGGVLMLFVGVLVVMLLVLLLWHLMDSHHAHTFNQYCAYPIAVIFGLPISVCIGLGLAASPLLLVTFGSACVHTGDDIYCGRSGADGGATMLFFGVVLTILALSAFNFFFRHSPEVVCNLLFISLLYVLCEILAALGMICVDSRGEDLCGAGGYDGGVAMLAFAGGGLLLAAGLALYMSLYRTDVAVAKVLSSVGVWVVCALPALLVVMGSLCLDSGHHCGAAGRDGGGTMTVLGVFATIGGALTICSQQTSPTKQMKENAKFISIMYISSELLCTFGSVCIKANNTICYEWDRVSGVVMTTVGVVLFVLTMPLILFNTTEENAEKMLKVTKPVMVVIRQIGRVVIAAGPSVLMIFGTICEAEGGVGSWTGTSRAGNILVNSGYGKYCGKAGWDGGVVMITVSCCIHLLWTLGHYYTNGRMFWNSIVFGLVIAAFTILSSVGAVCLSSNGTHLCGYNGSTDGAVMLSTGFGIFFLFACADFYFSKDHSFMLPYTRPLGDGFIRLVIFCTAGFIAEGPAFLMLFGSMCINMFEANALGWEEWDVLDRKWLPDGCAWLKGELVGTDCPYPETFGVNDTKPAFYFPPKVTDFPGQWTTGHNNAPPFTFRTDYCGEHNKGGGIAMLIAGLLLTVVVMYVFIYIGDLTAKVSEMTLGEGTRYVVIVLYFLCEVFVSAGAVCIHSDGESFCGGGGAAGGQVLVSLGTIGSLSLLCATIGPLIYEIHWPSWMHGTESRVQRRD